MPKKKIQKKKRIRITFRNPAIEKTYNLMEDDDPVKKKIKNTIEKIKNNPSRAGRIIGKKKVPKKYSKEGHTTIFHVELSREWRLVYSLSGNEVEILAVILDWWTNHKDYEKVFGY